VAEGKNQIVADVRNINNYLACSLRTCSEIVVLIRRAGQVIGQIDADADETAAFDTSDETLLIAVADRLGHSGTISCQLNQSQRIPAHWRPRTER
jgi:L-methionine (R)-S-oxide reductase